jgi:hypothetical protein
MMFNNTINANAINRSYASLTRSPSKRNPVDIADLLENMVKKEKGNPIT